jgi:hypothetical protein
MCTVQSVECSQGIAYSLTSLMANGVKLVMWTEARVSVVKSLV